MRGYSGAYGVSNHDAGKALGGILSDPVKGLETLNERFGFLKASKLFYVDSLVRQGREQKAVRVAIDAASTSLNQFAGQQGPLDRLVSWLMTRNEEVSRALARDTCMLPADPAQKLRDAENQRNNPDMVSLIEQARRSADSSAMPRRPAAAPWPDPRRGPASTAT